MAVNYEWVIETLDGPDGPSVEIIDVDHADTLDEAAERVRLNGLEHYRIALVRDSERERAWAYIENGVLAMDLTDSGGAKIIAVPVRFRDQFTARANA